jgi:hypothetical protein
MVEPITSAYQQTPWEPTVDLTGNKDSDQAGQKAAAQYTGIYGGSPTVTDQSPPPPRDASPAATAVPVLNPAYVQAPDFVPNAPPDSGGGTSADAGGASSSDPFYIDLGALLTAEQQCMNATLVAVEGYEILVNTVSAAIASDTIFGQHADGQDNQLNSEGQQFAATTDPQMQQLLNELGGVIEMMGQFNAMLNNAGQMYTYADDSSAFPSTEVIHLQNDLTNSAPPPT